MAKGVYLLEVELLWILKPQIKYPFCELALEEIKFPCQHVVISSEFVIHRYKFSGICDGKILSVKCSEKMYV